MRPSSKRSQRQAALNRSSSVQCFKLLLDSTKAKRSNGSLTNSPVPSSEGKFLRMKLLTYLSTSVRL